MYKKFSQKVNVKEHIMLIHESNPQLKYEFTCDVCHKKFSEKVCLKRHMLTHETNPDLKYAFTCEVCQKKFSQKVNLKRRWFMMNVKKIPVLKFI